MEELFQQCKRKFDVKTCCLLGKQMVGRIEKVHQAKILHRDIKPENFCIGSDDNEKSKDSIYLIGFGLGRQYMTQDGKHIPYKEGKSFTGTARYASVATHLGQEQSRRDDLE